MPGMDGAELVRIMETKYPDIKVLVLSMHCEAHMIKKLVASKVHGYLPKDVGYKELFKAMATIRAGKRYFSDGVKATYLNTLYEDGHNSNSPLTKREKEVLKLIAQEYTTKEIAEALCLSKYTIESYRGNLISKLQVKNLAGLTRHAIKLGLMDV